MPVILKVIMKLLRQSAQISANVAVHKIKKSLLKKNVFMRFDSAESAKSNGGM